MNALLILGMGPLEWCLTIFVFIVVGVVVYFQIKSSSKTNQIIAQIAEFFPRKSSFVIVKTSITDEIRQSESKLEKFINNPPARHIPEPIIPSGGEEGEGDDDVVDNELEELAKLDPVVYEDVDLIKTKNNAGSESFQEVLKETNAYLCKNVGTSADFTIIQDICERKIESLETQISKTINAPLYYGLIGTFIGIIVGVVGVAFNINSFFNAEETTVSPLTHLLICVGIAMGASLFGVFRMTRNTSVKFKKAIADCNENKNGYYDFVRTELMPLLSNSMASSLNSLKGVLGEFIGKFGHNLDAYANSAELLNDNIEKQHLLLVEINKMDQTKVATKIAETFNTLKESSESLNIFRNYQDSLNTTIEEVNTAVSKIDTIVNTFEDFSKSLKVVVKNQETAGKLQTQFASAMETHFPTGSEAREMWRKQFDELTSDAAEVSEQLNGQLKASTDYIKAFVQDNQAAFSSLSKLQDVLRSLVEYSNIQATCYQDLKDEIGKLKEEQMKAISEGAKINSALLEAVKELTKTVKNIQK